MTHTWRDLEELAQNEPALRQFIDGYNVRRLTFSTSREAMLMEALYWYVQALQASRAQLIEAEAMRPRIYYLPQSADVMPQDFQDR